MEYRSVDNSYCNKYIIPVERGDQVLDLSVWFDEKIFLEDIFMPKLTRNAWQSPACILRGIP